MLHKKHVNRGFTLVELLSVIVILAIILVIAVPKIMSVISDSKKSSLETSAKMIASSAEKMKMQNKLLGKQDDEITCDSVANLSNNDYTNCSITFDLNNNAIVNINGKGKFEGLYICNASKNNASAQTEECGTDTLASTIKSLYETDASNNGLIKDNTTDANIRYAGSNDAVKNYVAFSLSQEVSYNNNGIMQIVSDGIEETTQSTTEQEIWRIIGVFKVKTSSGVTEELVKLVKEEPIGELPWDISSENNGWGINQWGESGSYEGADLMRYLNGKASYSDIYGDGASASPATSNLSNIYATRLSTTADYYTINDTLLNMIETVVWNIGAINGNDTEMGNGTDMVMDTLKWYNYERGTLGKTCTSETAGDYCNDTVERTSTWTGKIALPYASDWAYASSTQESSSYVCHTNMWAGGTSDWDFTNGKCKINNWMHTQSSSSEATWMLSPMADSGDADVVSFVDGDGRVGSDLVYISLAARPAIYLKSNVQIKSGTGSQNDPYILS